MVELVFLKLGGSLITDKSQPYTARLEKLADLTGQIATVLGSTPDLRLVLGHGSGSFGHTAAKKYGTRQGFISTSASSPPTEREQIYWRGFAEVHFQATQLNHLVMQALHAAGLTALAFPPAGPVTARDGRIAAWDIQPIREALGKGILPIIYGDVAFDQARGGTILSTEDLFEHLAGKLTPSRILLAGLEAGVWEDFPGRTRLVNEINTENYEKVQVGLSGAVGADVTGGMESKVRQMLKLAQELGLKAQIFSGEEPGNLKLALENTPIGTLITA